MLGSVGSVVPKRWILGIFALGLIAVMVATSANPWAGASSLPTSVTATPLTPTSIQVDWTAADGTSTLPESGAIVDGYRVDCVPTSGTTATKSVTGRTTATATLTTNVVADTTYVCSVFSSSNTTLPSTGVPASSIKTPLSLAKQLGSVVASPTSGNVQVDGSLLLSAVSKGADTSKTAITGLTVNWSIVSGGGSVDASTGDSVTYTATSAGSVVVKAEVTQSATGITKSVTININNFAPPPPPSPPPPPADPDPVDIPDLTDFIDTIIDLPGIDDIGDVDTVEELDVAVVLPSTGAKLDLVASGTDDKIVPTEADVDIAVGALANDLALVMVAEFVPKTGDTSAGATPVNQDKFTPLPVGITPVVSAPLVIEFRDTSGDQVDVILHTAATVSVAVPNNALRDANQDPQSVALYKTKNPETDPWTELNTTFSYNADGSVKFSAQTKTFSTFRLGSKSRDTGVTATATPEPTATATPVPAVLPSAGDAAPTGTQAILVTGLGLLLILIGGVYVRRQRRANPTD